MTDINTDHDLQDAIGWIEEALYRLKAPSPNAQGAHMQTGGAYWRLTKAINYLNSRLDDDEGEKHAQRLRKTHGRLTFHEDDNDPSLAVMNGIILPALESIRSQYGDALASEMMGRVLLMLGTDYIAQRGADTAAKFFLSFAQMAMAIEPPVDD